MIIKAIVETRERNEDESTPIGAGKLRYRTNCLGKLIIQVKIEKFVLGKGWKNEWVDAKAHQVSLVDD